MRALFKLLLREEDGQDLTEYSLMVASIAMVALAMLSSLGADVNHMWNNAANQLSNYAGQSSTPPANHFHDHGRG